MNEFVFRDKNDYSLLINQDKYDLKMDKSIEHLTDCMVEYLTLLTNEECNIYVNHILEQRDIKLKEQRNIKIKNIIEEAQNQLNQLDANIILSIQYINNQEPHEIEEEEEVKVPHEEPHEEPIINNEEPIINNEEEVKNEDTHEIEEEEKKEEVKKFRSLFTSSIITPSPLFYKASEELNDFFKEQDDLYKQLLNIKVSYSNSMEILNNIDKDNTRSKYLSIFKTYFKQDGMDDEYGIHINSIKSYYQLNTLLSVISKITNITFDKKIYDILQSMAHENTKQDIKKKTDDLKTDDTISTIIKTYNELVVQHLQDGETMNPYLKSKKTDRQILLIILVQYILFNYGVRNNQLNELFFNPTSNQCGWTEEYIQLTNDKNNDDIRYIYLNQDKILNDIVNRLIVKKVNRIIIHNPASFKRDYITYTCSQIMGRDMSNITPTDFRRYHSSVDIE